MKLIFNSNAIQARTAKAYLIKLPKSELKFWYTKRFCTLKGKKDYLLELWYADDTWQIKAQRTGKRIGKHAAVLEERVLTINQLINDFNLEYAE